VALLDFRSSAYFTKAFEDPEVLVAAMQRRIASNQHRGITFDTLAGTGLSGALVIPGMARLLDVNWLIVRKWNEVPSPHSSHTYEGALGGRWMFIDDFMSSGRTRQRVAEAIRQIAERNNHATRYVGSYLYERDYFDTSSPFPPDLKMIQGAMAFASSD